MLLAQHIWSSTRHREALAMAFFFVMSETPLPHVRPKAGRDRGVPISRRNSNRATARGRARSDLASE